MNRQLHKLRPQFPEICFMRLYSCRPQCGFPRVNDLPPAPSGARQRRKEEVTGSLYCCLGLMVPFCRQQIIFFSNPNDLAPLRFRVFPPNHRVRSATQLHDPPPDPVRVAVMVGIIVMLHYCRTSHWMISFPGPHSLVTPPFYPLSRSRSVRGSGFVPHLTATSLVPHCGRGDSSSRGDAPFFFPFLLSFSV